MTSLMNASNLSNNLENHPKEKRKIKKKYFLVLFISYFNRISSLQAPHKKIDAITFRQAFFSAFHGEIETVCPSMLTKPPGKEKFQNF